MVYYLLASGAFRRHLQYRWAHMINNLASVGFGYIFIAVWMAVEPEKITAAPGGYSQEMLVQYVAFNQTLLWVAFFLPIGLGVPAAIRTGHIATEMHKPVPYFPMVLGRESGSVLYHLIFRAVPMAIVFASTTGYPAPHNPWSATMGVLLAAYTALCLHYLMGIAAFWTKEIRWVWWLFQASFAINGTWLPLDLLPDGVREVAMALPFAVQMYYPATIWFGLRGWEGLLPGLVWAPILTLLCLLATSGARRRMEVQGG